VGVAEPGLCLLELDELVVVRCEERAAAHGVVQVLGDRPGERDAVEGAGAAADLIEDDQAARGGVVEDVRGLGHLDHERALPAGRNSRSTMPIRALRAGTKLPTCARIEIKATWRM